MSDSDYQQQLEQIWHKMLPFLEWSDGFVLEVLFTHHPSPVRQLYQQVQAVSPVYPWFLESPLQYEQLLQELFAHRTPPHEHGVLWLEMWRDVGSAEERDALRRCVWKILSRLNERRLLLERDVACPLVIILPAALRQDVPAMVPDLWSVRAYATDLPVPVQAISAELMALDYEVHQLAPNPLPSKEELAWQQLQAQDKQRISPEAGFFALEQAMARLGYAAAEHIVNQLSAQITTLFSDDARSARQSAKIARYAGDVYFAQGNFTSASERYARCYTVYQHMQQTLGDAILPELCDALVRWADSEFHLRQLIHARDLYDEALHIYDNQPPSRELMITYAKQGDVYMALQNYVSAQLLYQNALLLSRYVQQTPQARRDLAVTLQKTAKVASKFGLWEQARADYWESQYLLRELGCEFELAIALATLAEAESELARTADASALLLEGIALLEKLGDKSPDIMLYKENLSVLRARFAAL